MAWALRPWLAPSARLSRNKRISVSGLVNHQRYHTLLQDAFNERRTRNARYSLRAFSRDLGISVTALSKVFRYERNLSSRNLRRLADFLVLSPAEIEKISVRKLGDRQGLEDKDRLLEEDTFRLISDWYYFAILSLSRTKSCKSDIDWIARRLGITKVEAVGAVRRLERLKLVERRGKRLVRTSEPVRTSTDVPSPALKKFHSQQLDLAKESLLHVPVALRDITSITMAIDPRRLQLAKEKIAQFRSLLCELLEGVEQTEVYLLSIQLFPLKKHGA